MEWLHTFTIIGSIVGVLFYVVQRLERDIDKLEKRIDKIDFVLSKHEDRFIAMGARIDQLYNMFVDLVKAAGIKPVSEDPPKKSKN